MKATVLRPFFDDLGLHRVGDVVEVKEPSDLVEIIAEETKPEPKPKKVEEPEKAEAKKPAKTTTSSRKKKG